LSARKFDQNGFMEIKDNPLSKVGVFPYLGKSIGLEGLEPDKVYNVYRPEEELSSPETIESFKLLPWIDEHTMLGGDYTPAEKKGVEGVTGEDIYFKDGYLKGNIRLFSEKLTGLIKSGKRELSCGYRCVYELLSGTYNGEAYDVVQRQIRGNHLALVDNGRMGKEVCVLDRKDMIVFDHYNISLDMNNEESQMNEAEIIELIKKVILETKHAADEEAAKKAADEEEEKKADDENEEEASDENEEEAKDEEEEAKDEEEEEKASDMAQDKAIRKLGKGFDAKIKSLSKQLEDVRSNGVKQALKQIDSRNQLAKQIATHVGAFDHAEMTLEDVAKYGVGKLKLKSEAGQEVATINGYLQHKTSAKMITLDSAVNLSEGSQVSKFLSGAN